MTSDDKFNDDLCVDGIQLLSNGRVDGYHIREGIGQLEKTSFFESKDVVHVFEPCRVGMLRGLPMVYPVLNDLHDLDDLQILGMDAAKEAAKVTAIIKTKTGELSMDGLRSARMTERGRAATSGGNDSQRQEYYDKVFSGRAKVLKGDDDYAQHNMIRPTGAEQELWDNLVSKVCAGVGISKLLVFPWSVQGTVVRADLDVMATYFRSRSSLLASKFKDIYLYVMEWGIKNDITLADPPHDWRRVKVRAPRSVNVDVGRNVTALVAEYEAGWRTLESICGELGEDWVEVLEQRGSEMAKAAEIEKRLKLPPGSLIRATLEAAQSVPQAPVTEEKV
jgi:capsid protein